MTTWVEWNEPFNETYDLGGIMRIRKEDAIKYQLGRSDIYAKFPDPEKEALTDFMAVRWAWLREIEE